MMRFSNEYITVRRDEGCEKEKKIEGGKRSSCSGACPDEACCNSLFWCCAILKTFDPSTRHPLQGFGVGVKKNIQKTPRRGEGEFLGFLFPSPNNCPENTRTR